jgi:hypothetical protein
VFINKLWKTGQICTNAGFIPVFSTFFHVGMWIPWREGKITNTQCVDNGIIGGKHHNIPLKNVDAWIVIRFGGGVSIPISGIKKIYACCFQQADIFTEVYSYPLARVTHNVKKMADTPVTKGLPVVDAL